MNCPKCNYLICCCDDKDQLATALQAYNEIEQQEIRDLIEQGKLSIEKVLNSRLMRKVIKTQVKMRRYRIKK